MEELPNTIEKYKLFMELYNKLPRDEQIKIEISFNSFYINSEYSNSFFEKSVNLPLKVLIQLVKYTTEGKINSYIFSCHKYRKDQYYALESLKYSLYTIKYIPIVLKLNKEFILRCIYELKTEAIKFIILYRMYVPNSFLLEDIDINIAILYCKSHEYGIPFNHIHPKYANDNMLIDIGLQNCIYNINVIDKQYITEERIEKMFKDHINNSELFTILQNYLTLERVFNVIKYAPYNFIDLPKEYMTKEITLMAVNSDGLLLDYADYKFKKDKDVVFMAELNNKLSIIYADESFITNEKILYLCNDANLNFNDQIILDMYIRQLPKQKQNNLVNKIKLHKVSELDIFNRNDVLSFVKKIYKNNTNIQIFNKIINKYIDDFEILSQIELSTINLCVMIDSTILYKYILNTKLPILYNLEMIILLDCIKDFNIEMIYNIVANYNKYLILFDIKYYDCKILNKYAVYYTYKQYKYFKLFLIRNIFYDSSFLFDNVIKYLIKYI